MASNIIFTIIVPVYNVEGYLKESIDSIINQTFDINSIEIILIDDGSSDSSGRICDEYSKKYDNIITIHIKNSGVSAARNVGLQRACGKYIGFLDSDDKFSVDVIEKVHSFFIKNSDVDVTSIPRIYFDGQTGDHILNDKFKKGTRVIDLNSEYNMLQNSVTFFTKNSIEDVFFDEKLKYSEDTKFVLTVLNKNRKLGVVSDCCYYYRKRADGNKSAVDTARRNLQSPA